MSSRREFCASLTATLAAAYVAPFARAAHLLQDAGLRAEKLRENIWALVGGGGNSMLTNLDESAVLVDTKVAGVGRELHKEIESMISRGPHMVINTHHHADHIGGNFAFSKDATLVAHRNVKPRIPDTLESRIKPQVPDIAASLTPAAFEADTEVDSTLSLDHDGTRIELRHFGFGHTDNDIVVHFPDQNVLHMGDLVFHELHPFIDRSAKATTVGWQHSLAEAEKLCDRDTIVVPGHGEITDRTALPKMSTYFDQLREIVAKAIKDGKTRDEVSAMQPDVFKERGFKQIQARSLGAMFDELSEGA